MIIDAILMHNSSFYTRYFRGVPECTTKTQPQRSATKESTKTRLIGDKSSSEAASRRDATEQVSAGTKEDNRR